MLVLSRKVRQKFRIGNNIIVTVLKIQGEQVSIGIEAPKDLSILRQELLEEDLIQTAVRENKNSVIDKTTESKQLKNQTDND